MVTHATKCGHLARVSVHGEQIREVQWLKPIRAET
jgi:hypothetical protein